MTISILGCGWYGRALAGALLTRGITVKASTTTKEKLSELAKLGLEPYMVNLPVRAENGKDFFDCDVLIISMPPKFRHGEADLFIPKIKSIVTAIQHAGIKKIIYISSTGVYAENQGIVDELTLPEPNDESGKLLLQAEQIFQSAADFKTTVIRFAGLIGPGRDPGKFFAGKKDVPNGLSPVNLIHLNDAVGITQAVIEKDCFGKVFNACSPHHPARAVFYTAAAEKAGLPLPEFISEAQANKVVESTSVNTMLNYVFHTN